MRWFWSARCDLIVWLADDGTPEGFQFCYDKDYVEHALTWMPGYGFSHMRVDSGGAFGWGESKGTPLLLVDGDLDADRMLEIFAKESAFVPGEYVELVSERLAELTAKG